MKKPELLAPAGNLEKLQMAIHYGADAVYLGGKSFGLRAGADNFTVEEIAVGLDFARKRGAKVYVTVNIFPHNKDLEELPGYLKQLAELQVDAIIASDPGVIMIAKETVPEMPIHLSTQANNVNWASARFWEQQGISRIVLARELSLEEISEIRQRIGVELEAFVHGAMCISYSGRCLLSNYMADRDANLGECAQPCRWKYSLVEEKRPGQYFPIFEDERGTYIFNSHDLSMIDHIPELVQAGIDSFKIEGRMKSVHYVATVVKSYRQAIDSYCSDPDNFQFNSAWKEEILKVSHREYTTGFYFGKMGTGGQNYQSSSYHRFYDFVALVRSYDPVRRVAELEQRNKIKMGDKLEFVGPHRPPFTAVVQEMWNEEGEPIFAAPHPQMKLSIRLDREVQPFDMVRREKAGNS